MKTNLAVLGGVLLALFASSCATVPQDGGGTAQVNFQSPENFTDMGSTYMTERGADPGYISELQKYIEERAQSRLPAGSSLDLTITDVDMAGRFEPEQGPNFTDVRFVREIYPPRIQLTYRLTDTTGAVRGEGQRTLFDQSFQWRISPITLNDPLRYEKALIDDFLSEMSREARATRT
ncbi:MAG: DUF3016 domain-containing protein [Opitutus sp.]